MKKTLIRLLNVMAIALLPALTAHAGGTVVLESFEKGFTTNSEGQTNLAIWDNWGSRGGGDAILSIYTATNPADPRVTDGTNSVKAVFPVDGYGSDFSYALSDAAATILENAASSNQLARYILRYDIVFEHYDQLNYYNQHFLIANDWEYVRSGGAVVTTYNGIEFGKVSFSVPLELPGIDFPTNAPSTDNANDFAAGGVPGISAIILDQFAGNTEPLTNFTIYIDNVRLVDTYATASTAPVVYQLQSFENPATPLGGATDTSGVTTLSEYTTNGAYNPASYGGVSNVDTGGYPNTLNQVADFSVTDGSNSLEVTVNAPYYTYGIFTLPFTNDILSQLMATNPVPSTLTNYTLRFDVTTPMVPTVQGGSDGDYINIDYNGLDGAPFPMSTGRRQSMGQTGLQRETYSLTLDQIAYWPNSTINFSYSEPAANWTQSPFFFDNFVLVNTAPATPTFSITAESYNATTKQFTLTFNSMPSKTYSVKFTPDLRTNFSDTLATGIASGGSNTTTTVTVPGGSAGYLLVTSP